jgi:hypothetical protein
MQLISLRTALPEFAAELELLLRAEGETALASQVSQLMIVNRCRCPDDFCATFYTSLGDRESCNPIPGTIVLEPENGVVNIDVTSGKITCIEVLYRPDVKEVLQAMTR